MNNYKALKIGSWILMGISAAATIAMGIVNGKMTQIENKQTIAEEVAKQVSNTNNTAA